MSAETLGAELLREVTEEGLDELLRSLREHKIPANAPLGFPPLDKLLNVFQNPPLTRQQQHYHHTQLSTLHQAHTPTKEKPSPVIEIIGATACSGKSQLLYHLTSLSLLPAKYNDVLISGKEHAVVLLDLSSKFSILRLYDVMTNYISSVSSTTSSVLSNQEITSLVTDALTHLHIFRPQSSSSLTATLASLPSYLLTQPSIHLSINRPIGLLIINDLGSFLWQDRLDADDESSVPTNVYAEKANQSPFIQRYRALVSSLRNIQHRFSCTIVATNWGLAPVISVAGHRALRSHLPSVWNNFCTVKVVVERDRVKKFGPGTSAEEAMKEGPLRWEAVDNSGFSGWVNWWESESWREEVREGVRGLERGGSFSFHVTDEGFAVGDDD